MSERPRRAKKKAAKVAAVAGYESPSVLIGRTVAVVVLLVAVFVGPRLLRRPVAPVEVAQPEPVQSVASVVSEPPRPKVKVDVNERSLAEYILSLDGTVTIEDSTDSRLFISRADQLPQVCRVVQVGLSGSAKVHDESFAKLAELKAIEKRWLGQTAITNTSLKLIRSLATLESLNVEETKITESGLPHIARLTNLRDLRLDVPLSDAGLAELKPLRQLKQFSFVGGKVTDFGLGLVCETFPELTHVVTD